MERMKAAVDFIGSLGGFGWAVSVCVSILLLVSVLHREIWRPYKLHTVYRSMHLRGPSYRPFVGHIPEIWNLQRQVLGMKPEPADPADLAARCLPHLTLWSKLYGKMFTYMEGAKVNLCVLDTQIIREILVHKADCYRRSPSGSLWLNSHGASRHLKHEVMDANTIHHDLEHWATLRRIWGPMSDKDHVQGSLQTIVQISNTLVRNWAQLLNEAPDGAGRVHVDVKRDIKKRSMEMFLANLLGSTVSTDQLEAVYFHLGQAEEEPASATDLLKSHLSRIRSRSDRWLIRLLTETIEARLKSSSEQWESQEGDAEEVKKMDLLDLLISTSGRRSSTQQVQKLVADCQMLIEAQKATSQLTAQTLQLLARHRDWQIRARAEIQAIRPLDSPEKEEGENPSSCYPNLAKLKLMNMILNESLRLYPPVPLTEKLCEKRHRLGKYTVLPGTSIQIPIVLVHHSPELWGEDTLSFRPERFADGAGVRRPFALLPFSAGPFVCLGYNLALQEAKIVLASTLKSFSFDLLPDNLTTNSSSSNCLVIRRFEGDDFAVSAKRQKLPPLSTEGNLSF